MNPDIINAILNMDNIPVMIMLLILAGIQLVRKLFFPKK